MPTNSGARLGNAQPWRNSCNKCGAKNHTDAGCIQCGFCKWWGHSENQCPNLGSGGGNGGNGTNNGSSATREWACREAVQDRTEEIDRWGREVPAH